MCDDDDDKCKSSRNRSLFGVHRQKTITSVRFQFQMHNGAEELKKYEYAYVCTYIYGIIG